MMLRFLWGTLLFFAAAVLSAQVPEGIRSNNPGNIHGSHPEQWGGAVSSDEYGYLRFDTPLDGLRAMKRVLVAYQAKHGIRTVSGIVNRWVRKPHGRSQILALRQYMLLLGRRSGYGLNQRLNLYDAATEIRLERAIVFAENSQQPYPDSLFRQAVAP